MNSSERALAALKSNMVRVYGFWKSKSKTAISPMPSSSIMIPRRLLPALLEGVKNSIIQSMECYTTEEPIYALATPFSPSALAVIRASGNDCLSLIGDCFTGSFAAGLILFNYNIENAIELAIKAAGESVTKRGAQPE